MVLVSSPTKMRSTKFIFTPSFPYACGEEKHFLKSVYFLLFGIRTLLDIMIINAWAYESHYINQLWKQNGNRWLCWSYDPKNLTWPLAKAVTLLQFHKVPQDGTIALFAIFPTFDLAFGVIICCPFRGIIKGLKNSCLHPLKMRDTHKTI